MSSLLRFTRRAALRAFSHVKYTRALFTQLKSVSNELKSARLEILKLNAKAMVGEGAGKIADAGFDRSKPSILFNALPKSASTFCYMTLMEGLDLFDSSISLGYFPRDMIVFNQLERFALGGQIAHHHIDATPANIYFLNQFKEIKIILHVRDPRQTLLSWAHHIKKSGVRYSPIYTIAAFPPGWYYDPFDQQLDWLIDNHTTHFTNWIQEWVDAEESGQIDVLFTTFESFLQDRETFFDRILSFSNPDNITHSGININPSLKTEHQFRVGQADEFRSVFSEAQIQRINAQIPAKLSEKFGWD